MLAVAGVIVAALLVGSGHHRNPGTTGAGTGATPIPIATVKVVVFPPMHSPDNPGEAVNTHDGNPNTAWSSDRYFSRNFGGLGGEGLAVQLSGAQVLHTLTVTSPTQGWAARTYVADQAGTDALSQWGSPTTTKTNISGSTTFSLGGQKGSWVLLWLTDTGPSEMVSINELAVS